MESFVQGQLLAKSMKFYSKKNILQKQAEKQAEMQNYEWMVTRTYWKQHFYTILYFWAKNSETNCGKKNSESFKLNIEWAWFKNDILIIKKEKKNRKSFHGSKSFPIWSFNFLGLGSSI